MMNLALYESTDGLLLASVGKQRYSRNADRKSSLRAVGWACVITADLSAELVAALRELGHGPAQPSDVRGLLANLEGAPPTAPATRSLTPDRSGT